MASKPGKEKKDTGKIIPDKESSKKESSKPKKQMEEDNDDDDVLEDDDTDVKPAKKGGKAAASKKGKGDDDDDDDGPDEVDEWEKVEEEENWDPDFEEFDIPKSKGKKSTGVAGKKAVAPDDEDFKIDDEFKDMFDEGDGFDDEEDDY
jgi:DNA-directed RNA polymerase subunit delta